MVYTDPIIIRTRKLKNGNESIYLESNTGEKRTREYLKLYLIPESSDADREKNELTMRLAQGIRAERYKEYASQNSEAGLSGKNESDMLLVDFIKEYDRLRLAKGGSTKQSIYHYLVIRINTYAPDIKLNEVNRFFVNRLFSNIIDTGCLGTKLSWKPLTDISICRYSGGLSAVLNHAVAKGLIANNPMPHSDYRASRFKHSQIKTRDYLTQSELKRLIDTPYDNKNVRALFIFGCATGLRYSDIKTLQWKHIRKTNHDLQIEKLQHKTKIWATFRWESSRCLFFQKGRMPVMKILCLRQEPPPV